MTEPYQKNIGPMSEYDKMIEINRLRNEVKQARTTLRDQFAMAALQGMFAQGDYGGTDDLPEIAYRVADAMLKARAGEQE